MPVKTWWPMRNDCYVKSKDWWKINTLCFDAMAGPRHLYTIALMQVETSETDLNGGRFTKFVRESQEFKVVLPFNNMSAEEVARKVADLVTWIHYQQGDWSFEVVAHHVSSFDIAFTFQSAVTAVTFKLVWF